MFPWTPVYTVPCVPGSTIIFHLAPLPAGHSAADQVIFEEAANAAAAEWNRVLGNLTITISKTAKPAVYNDGINEIFIAKKGTQYGEWVCTTAGTCFSIEANNIEENPGNPETDIWVNDGNLDIPESAFHTILHEMGHAIGLTHLTNFIKEEEDTSSIMYPASSGIVLSPGILAHGFSDMPDIYVGPITKYVSGLQAFDILYAGTLYGVKPSIEVPPLYSDSLYCETKSIARTLPGEAWANYMPETTQIASWPIHAMANFSRTLEWRVDGSSEWTSVPMPNWTYKASLTDGDYYFDLPLLMGKHTYEFRSTNNRATSNVKSFTITRIDTVKNPPTLAVYYDETMWIDAEINGVPFPSSIPGKPIVKSGPKTFQGTVEDYASTFRVDYSLNGGPWVENVATCAITSEQNDLIMAKANWTVNVQLTPGKNTIQFRTVNQYGESTVITRKLTYSPQTTVTVNPADGGSVTKGFAGTTSRKAGTDYKVTAVPAKGMIFKEWQLNGSSYSRNATVTFTAQDGMSLTPVFTQNPYPALAGTYVGLFGAGDTADTQFTQHNGLVGMTVTKTGAFTGYVIMGGVKRPFSGKLDGFQEDTLTIKTGKLADIPLSVSLGTSATGTVNGIAFTADTNVGKHPLAGAAFAGTLAADGKTGGKPRLFQKDP